MARKRLFALGAGILLTAGCSFSIGDTPTNAAEDLIEGELATDLGLTDVASECETPDNDDVGSTFGCTSTSSIGDITYLVTIEDEDEIFVETTNVLTADDVNRVTIESVSAIEAQSGRRVGAENFSCGEGPVALASDLVLDCDLIDPDNGETFAVGLQLLDMDTGSFDLTGVEEFAAAAPVEAAPPADPGTPAGAAELLIEGDLAAQLAISEVDAVCESPSSDEVGTTFTCASTSNVGNVAYVVTIDAVDSIFVETQNLLNAEFRANLTTAAVDVIEQQSERPLGYENFDCGTGPIALQPGETLSCALTDPDNGDVYDAEVDITDFTTGAFGVDVADQPRG